MQCLAFLETEARQWLPKTKHDAKAMETVQKQMILCLLPLLFPRSGRCYATGDSGAMALVACLDRFVGQGEEGGPLSEAPSRSAGNRKSRDSLSLSWGHVSSLGVGLVNVGGACERRFHNKRIEAKAGLRGEAEGLGGEKEGGGGEPTGHA